MTATTAPPRHPPSPSPSSDGTPPVAHEVERLLTAGIAITARAIEQTPEAKDLTLLQWRVLVVAGQPSGIRIGELASHLGVSVPSASRLVRRVEARDLVSATRDEDDRRVTTVALSRRGRRVVEAVVGRRRSLIRRALDDVPLEHDASALWTISLLANELEALA